MDVVRDSFAPPGLFMIYGTTHGSPWAILWRRSAAVKLLSIPVNRFHSSLYLLLIFLEILLQKTGHVLELRHVGWVNLHERLVRLQASAGNFLAVGCAAVLARHIHVLPGGRRPLKRFEEMGDAEIFEQVGDPAARAHQLDRRRIGAARFLGKLQSEPGEDPKEGAVHELTLREIEHKSSVTALPES